MPPVASAALMQALALDPGQRPASAAAMRAALTGSSEHLQPRAASGQQPAAVVSPTISLEQPRQRRSLLFAIAGAVVVVLLLAFFLLARR